MINWEIYEAYKDCGCDIPGGVEGCHYFDDDDWDAYHAWKEQKRDCHVADVLKATEPHEGWHAVAARRWKEYLELSQKLMLEIEARKRKCLGLAPGEPLPPIPSGYDDIPF